MSTKTVLDDLDKRIIHHICSGVYSYKDLGQRCKVGRNTIYRRIKRLEDKRIINKIITAIPNFKSLELSAIGIMIDVAVTDMDQTIEFLKRLPNVKFLWKSYGTHNITAVIACDKGDEGKCIFKVRETLEKKNVKVHKFDASISFSWEKVDLSPY